MFLHTTNPTSIRTRSAVLILHGLFGSHRNWQTASRILADRLHSPIMLADLRNHGRSVRFGPKGDPLGEGMGWPELVSDLEETLSKLTNPETQFNDLTLIGHSLGGLIVMQALFSSPRLCNLVRRAVIIDMPPRPCLGNSDSNSRGGTLHYLEAMIKVDQEALPRSQAMDLFRRIAQTDQEGLVQFLFTNYGRLGDEERGRFGFLLPLTTLLSGVQRLGETFMEHLEEARIHTPKVHLPILFLRGSLSDYIHPTRDQERITQLFPHSQLYTLDGCGHWPHVDNPELLSQKLASFIDKRH